MTYFYISLVTYICYCIIKYREGLYYLKKDKFDTKKYLKGIKDNSKKIFLNLEALALILIIVSIHFDIKVIGICTVITYMILFLYKLKKDNKQIKTDKKITTRFIVILIIYLLINVWFILDYISYHSEGLHFENSPLYYIILVLLGYLSCFVVLLANAFSKPLDKKKKK